MRDIAVELSRRGHRTRVLTGAPAGAPVRRRRVDGVPVTYLRVWAPPTVQRRGWRSEHVFGIEAVAPLSLARSDLVHALHYADAWAATRVRRRRPVVLKLTGTVLPDRLARPSVDARMFLDAVRDADEVWCNSAYASEVMAGFGREMAVVPAGLDTEFFTRTGDRDPEPLVVCTAAAADPRKRVIDLMSAWPAVLSEVPSARLVLAGEVAPSLREELLRPVPPERWGTVQFAGSLDGPGLRELYGRAHATVAPARFEALGLATVESLSMGTPVAGARSGATPEVVSPGTGVLFEPGDIDGCAAAIVGSMRLCDDPNTTRRCRDAALRYDIGAVVTDIERRYAALAGRHL